jgi:hypothetical protein
VRYGAGDGDGAFSTFLPERITRHTFQVFGPLILCATVLVLVRWGLAVLG